MEVDVRSVPGMQSCFAALPLHLIQTLQTTYSGFLPPLLALEIRPLDHTKTKASSWHLAWIGAASQSTAIEVAEKLAECIGLPDFTRVYLRAQADLPKATMVMLEPASEDDWEILELNADFAEEHILNQVGIVQEGFKFPLWLRGHTIITFYVASTSPKQSVVQLVPGTELAVAPKRRKQSMSTNLTTERGELDNAMTKASLRVQELERSLLQTCKSRSLRFGVVPTSVAFLSPDTAEGFSLSNGQLAILTSMSGETKISLNYGRQDGRKKSQPYVGEKANITTTDDSKRIARQVICQLVFLETVSRGHIMLARSLRLYIGANIHTRVLVKGYSWPSNQQPPVLLLSPVCFIPEKGKSHKENGLDDVDDKGHFPGSADTYKESDTFVKDSENIDWSKHKEILACIDCMQSTEEEHDALKASTCQSKTLLQSWISRQISFVSRHVPGQGLDVLAIGRQTILHFEVNSISRRQDNMNSPVIAGKNTVNINNGNGEVAEEVMFLLSVVDNTENLDGDQIYVHHTGREFLPDSCQIYTIKENAFSLESEKNEKGSELKMTEVKLGQPLRFVCNPDKCLNGSSGPTLSSLSWMEPAASEALKRLTLLLSPKSDKIFRNLGLPLPGHVLLHGTPASGKTQLALALARHLAENPHILAHVAFVSCSKFTGEQPQAVRGIISRDISEALDHSPSLVVFDDLDSVISSSVDSEGSELSSSAIGLAEFLADLMDACQDRGHLACGISPVAFLAVVRSPAALPGCLCSSGRFDFHVQLPAPAATERAAILKHEISRRSLQCSEHIISETASKCDGYDTSDLEILVDRAVHAAATRSLSSQRSHSLIEGHSKPELLAEDFSQALENFLPAAMRGITKSGSQGGRTGWEDVGGLIEIRNAIQEMLELPVKFAKIFSEAPLRLRSGVLLYGPPGCGKTHIVGAAAAACSLRFISVKGPELLNKYIGASEQAVRDIFSKASAAAPCILFFDEFDSIAPKRGHDNTGVTDRVVNQLLTELDGVEALNGVFVFAATSSRPDLLDAALLRPGRLDRLLFCDFPSTSERLEILQVLSRKLPLAPDVDLGAVASLTKGFSGADLQSLLSDAQLESVHGFLENAVGSNDGTSAAHPLITNLVLESVVLKARPSVPKNEKQRLYEIYSQFLNSRTSVAAKTREAKGKRATLA
eukprot:Gb_20751 [translate_table: standard]